MPVRRLFRKQHDRMIAGVCSGLAEYMGVDVVVVRLVCVAVIILSGLFPGALVYLVAVLLIPVEPVGATNASSSNASPSQS